MSALVCGVDLIATETSTYLFFLSFPTLLEQLTFPLYNSSEISRLWMSGLIQKSRTTNLNKQRLKKDISREKKKVQAEIQKPTLSMWDDPHLPMFHHSCSGV